MELTRIGDIINDFSDLAYKKCVIINEGCKYFPIIKGNKNFYDIYYVIQSRIIDSLDFTIPDVDDKIVIGGNIVLTHTVFKKSPIQYTSTEKITNIIDNILVTENHVYIMNPKSYFRDKKIEKLGIY